MSDIISLEEFLSLAEVITITEMKLIDGKRFCVCGNPLISSPVEGWLDCQDERCAEMYRIDA